MSDTKSLQEQLDADMIDSLDEELEMELDDDRLDGLVGKVADGSEHQGVDRKLYFTELLRLQRELIKLQDWVVHQKLKVVVLFEGRDAAGKGGCISRIASAMSPRVTRVVALSVRALRC